MAVRVRYITALVCFAALLGGVAPASAHNKYSRYIKASPASLFEQCVQRADDIACYFFAGLQKIRGKLAEAHDAFFLGAQLARERAGFVCMLELARMYERGEGTRQDVVQAYRWYTVLMNDHPAQDLRAEASNKRQALAASMTTDQIAKAEAMARAWKAQSGA